MIATDVIAAPSFKLKPVHYYFADAKTQLLMSAALAGDLPKAKRLVSEGADPNCEGTIGILHNRFRPLHYAIAANKPEAVRTLMAVGADPEMKTEGPGRATTFAVTLDKVEMLRLMLELRPISSLSRDTLKALFHSSVTLPRPHCLEVLFDLGAPIDFQDDAGYTIMMRAMDTQDYELAEWLLRKGASVHIDTASGMTPAYGVQFHLNKYKPGSPTYNKVLHLKKMMEERGAVFPAPTPAEVRARRQKQ